MKSLLAVTRIDLKETSKQLSRIADVLEAYMSHVHGYNMRPPKPVSDSGEPESIEYSDDEQTTLNEVRELMHKVEKEED